MTGCNATLPVPNVVVDVKGNANDVHIPRGTPVAALMPDIETDFPLIAARINNEVVSLNYPLQVNGTVEFLDAADPHGWRVYRNSLCFLLAKATHDALPAATLRVEHSFGPGLYCSLDLGVPSTEAQLEQAIQTLSTQMHQWVKDALAIDRLTVSYTAAVKMLEAIRQKDKLHLLQHRNPPHITLNQCEGFCDLAQGPLATCTAVFQQFALIPYPPGFVLHMPDHRHPHTLEAFRPQPHLFKIYQEHKEWGRISGITTVGQLNHIIVDNDIEAYIQTCEALHEKKLARIADQITTRPEIKIVLIAGPSSAGKTTFAKRLKTHLRVNGHSPHMLSTDDYFVGEANNPVGRDGKPDYEHINAVDLDRLNSNLSDLLKGKAARIPTYDFMNKRPVFNTPPKRIQNGDILIIEGIHALNPKLTERIPRPTKFMIYVSALTQLGIDNHNRISTTDNRLMRRIVRDKNFRGHAALETLKLWPKVRAGEKRWIFPFQHLADATFNSALDYELAVLKPFVEQQLMTVKPYDSEYAEARRLNGFLDNFLEISDRAVPGNSILREYIGGSALHY